MQIIIRVGCTPEVYSAAQRHSAIPPPKKCPNCGQTRSLVSLGYYQRWLSGVDTPILRLLIRRFRCRVCGRSVSLLPDFAQPYRIVRNDAIEDYFVGDTSRVDVMRWSALLALYWRRFTIWLPDLREVAARSFGRGPPVNRPQKWWSFLVSAAGDLARATRRLVAEARVTIFGRYRCHRPNPAECCPQT